MQMRIMGMPEEIDKFIDYLQNLEKLGEINLISISSNYPNRCSKEVRNYIRLELNKETNEILQGMQASK